MKSFLMKMSLYQRLSLSVSCAFIMMASIFFYWNNSLADHAKYQAEQKLHFKLAQHLAQDNPLLQDGLYDKKALENLFHTLMLLGPAFEFYFLDPAGNILTYSADPAKIKRQSVNLSPLVALISSPKDIPIFGDDPRHLSNQKIFSAAPIYQGDHLQGYLLTNCWNDLYSLSSISILLRSGAQRLFPSKENNISVEIMALGTVMYCNIIRIFQILRGWAHVPIR